MQTTGISWTSTTWNPVHGCSKVSAGCENCYAERRSLRYDHTEEPWEPENADENVLIQEHKLEEPYLWDEPQHVFVNSMGDLFHSQVPDEYIRDCMAIMRNCPQHVFQILTKRPGRAAQLEIQWPPNVWMGTSVEDHRVTDRLDLLRPCGAELLFVSFEPLIGPVGDVDLSGYGWAIVGGESGPDFRDMEHEWAREIYNQARMYDLAFFFKQSAAPYPEQGRQLTVKNEAGGFFEQRRIQELPDLPDVTRAARASIGGESA